MRVSAVSARWAQALFELASEKDVLDQVERDVEFLGAELSVPSVAEHLFDARVPHDEVRRRVDLLRGHVQKLTGSFLSLLLDRRRLGVLRELPAAFHALVLARRGAVEGAVESPRPLADAELAKLQTALGARLGKTVTLERRLVPELLAGARVFVENKLIDQTAVGRMEGLRERMLASRLP